MSRSSNVFLFKFLPYFINMATNMDGSRIDKDSIERKCVKILILGDYGIGKTTLIKTYLGLDDDIPEEENIFEEYRARIKYDGKEVDVGLLDLSPGISAPERRQFYPTSVKAILLCFSIGHYESLKCVYNLWIHEARAHYGKRIPIFLVGLRSDVRFFDCPNPDDRIVEKSEAEIFHKNCPFYGDYMECSMYFRCSVIHVINKAFVAAMED